MQYPIIDSHCHIYPDKIARKAVDGISNFYDLPMCFDGKASTLVEEGNKIGVCHNVIFSVATTPSQVRSINKFISECVQISGGRFTGLGALHPDIENIDEEIQNILSLNLKGIKMHPDFQKFKINDEKLFPIYDACSRMKLPLLLHTGDYRYDYSNPARMADVLKNFPELTVVGAHFGGWSVWDEAVETLAEFDNFYVDTCSSFNWLNEKRAVEIIRKYGADKVLFATDFPMWSYEDEYDFFMKLNLDENERRQILYENSAKVFNIELF